jgi:hypothetical protein
MVMLPLVAISDYAARTANLKRQVIATDVLTLSGSATDRDRAAAIRSSSYVWLAAALEVFVSRSLSLVLSIVNSSVKSHAQLRPSLLALVLHPQFESLVTVRGLKQWGGRARLLQLVIDTGTAIFGDQHPLDGRTLRHRHFETIWSVYGLEGEPLPSPVHGLALLELAEWRNKLAHGRVDPISFGRTKALRDVVRLIDLVDDVAQHLHIASDAYVSKGGYLR